MPSSLPICSHRGLLYERNFSSSSMVLCRLNYLLDRWLIWFPGACRTQQTGTTSGRVCLEGWIGKGTSQPPLLTRSQWARWGCAFTLSRIG